jgi:hypothetical protein
MRANTIFPGRNLFVMVQFLKPGAKNIEIIFMLLLMEEKTLCIEIPNLPVPRSFRCEIKKEHPAQLFSCNFVLPLVVN